MHCGKEYIRSLADFESCPKCTGEVAGAPAKNVLNGILARQESSKILLGHLMDLVTQ